MEGVSCKLTFVIASLYSGHGRKSQEIRFCDYCLLKSLFAHCLNSLCQSIRSGEAINVRNQLSSPF